MELALKTVMLRETASWTQTAPLDKNVATAVNVYQARHCVHCLQSSPWLFLFLYFSALFLSSVFALTILPVQCTRLSNGVVWELYSNSNRQPGPDEHISYDLSIINSSRSCLFVCFWTLWSLRTFLSGLSIDWSGDGKMYDMCEKRLVIAENTRYKLI